MPGLVLALICFSFVVACELRIVFDIVNNLGSYKLPISLVLGWMVGWWVGLVGWLVGWLDGWWVGLVGWLVGWLCVWLVG